MAGTCKQNEARSLTDDASISLAGENHYFQVQPRFRSCVLIFFVTCFLLFGSTIVAHAATWPVSGERLSTSLGFHETYTRDQSTYTHQGVDIPATAGTAVRSPVVGVVSFVGRVPAECADQTMLALTVKMASGRKITLMPLAAVGLIEGDTVGEGEQVGTLAASGDWSSGATHLHMGYKDGSAYLDPLLLFGASSVSTATPLPQEETSAASTATETATAAVATDASVVSTRTVDTPQTVETPAAQESFGTISSAQVDWEPETAGEASVFEPLRQGLVNFGKAVSQQFSNMCAGIHALACELGVPYLLLWVLGALALLAAVTAGVLGISRGVSFLLGRMRNSEKFSLAAFGRR